MDPTPDDRSPPPPSGSSASATASTGPTGVASATSANTTIPGIGAQPPPPVAAATAASAAVSSPSRFSLPPPPVNRTGPLVTQPGATQSVLPTVIHLPARRTMVPWLVAAAIVALAFVFRQALTIAFTAFAIAYVFAPSVKRVQRFGVPRPLAILIVLLAGTTLVATVVSVLVPELLRQIETLIRSVPTYSDAIQRRWIPWLRHNWHLPLPPRTEDALAQLGIQLSEIAPRVASLLNSSLAYTLVALEYLLQGLIVMALAFYILMDFDGVLDAGFDLVPHRARDRVRSIAREVDETLRHFVHGQLLVMAILGGLYSVGLGALGVPAGWAIGLFAGMISFVPYLGFFVALGLALFMTALQGNGVAPMIAVTGVMTAVHILDLTVITPRILGGRAKVSPTVVILGLVAGGSVFGFVGILVAIPVSSVLRVLLREVVNHYKGTQFFLQGSPMQAPTLTQFSLPTAGVTTDGNGALFVPSLASVPSMPVIPPLAPPPPGVGMAPGTNGAVTGAADGSGPVDAVGGVGEESKG